MVFSKNLSVILWCTQVELSVLVHVTMWERWNSESHGSKTMLTVCLLKELLRDQTEEQSFQCGFHPHILIVTNQAQQTSPSMISDDCFDHQLHTGHCLGVFSSQKSFCVAPPFDILNLHFHVEHQSDMSMQTGHGVNSHVQWSCHTHFEHRRRMQL